MAGLVHIYCGDGKGKTTAAIGLAVRAAGCGKKVLIARFMKTDASGEVRALASIPEITVLPCQKSFGFSWEMSGEDRKEAAKYYESLCAEAFEKAAEGIDMLVLDEIMAVCGCGLLDEETVRNLIENRPPDLEVALTGRDPSPAMVDLADYVSEIRKVKHPFDQGLSARRGIEY